MSNLQQLNREAAEDLFKRFAPMFAEFEKRGVDYCLVGGLAVVAHCLSRGHDQYRATEDADAMVPKSYSNLDFARDYLRVYATGTQYSQAIYDAVIGDGGFEQLKSSEYAFINASFVGADADLDGIDTPDFDICRTLNNRTLNTIERERVKVCNQTMWVATVNELRGMKHDTAAIYGLDIQTNPRPQDFIDIKILDALCASTQDSHQNDSADAGGAR